MSRVSHNVSRNISRTELPVGPNPGSNQLVMDKFFDIPLDGDDDDDDDDSHSTVILKSPATQYDCTPSHGSTRVVAPPLAPDNSLSFASSR